MMTSLWQSGALPERYWDVPVRVLLEVKEDNLRNRTEIMGTIMSSELTLPLPMKVKLRCHACSSPLKPGLWSADVKLKPIHAYANPGARDGRATQLHQGIMATGVVIGAPSFRAEQQEVWGIESIRQHLREHIRASTYSMKPLLLGLVLGDKSLLGPEHWKVLRDTGTAHLLAISGLHLSIIASVIYSVALLCMRIVMMYYPRWPAQFSAWICSCFLSYPYVLLTGSQISAWRAYIMLLCTTMVIVGKRSSFQVRDLAIVTALVMIVQPFSVLSISLWLSVGAVAVILLIGGQYSRLKSWYKPLILQWRMSLTLGLLACMMLNTLSLASPLANIIAIPFVSMITVPLCFMYTVLFMMNQSWAEIILWCADLSLQGLWWFLKSISDHCDAITLWISQPWQWCSAIILLLLSILPSTRFLRVISLILVLGVIYPSRPHPAMGEAWIDVLDVGQGLAIVVRTQAHTLIYDTGAGYGDHIIADHTLIPFLQHEHMSVIDTVMISHADNDHRGGLYAVQAAVQVKAKVSGEPRDPDETACITGQAWTWEQVNFTVISPQANEIMEHNNRSCVLKISVGTHAVLLTGDIEAKLEHELLAKRQSLKADVLLVPHHGSKTSSSEDFLTQVDPEHAIVSAGFMNRYHHPHLQVVKRYQDRGIMLWNTAQNGAMHVKISRSGAKVFQYKQRGIIHDAYHAGRRIFNVGYLAMFHDGRGRDS